MDDIIPGLVLLSVGLVPWGIYWLVPTCIKNGPFGIFAIIGCALGVPVILELVFR